MPQKTIMSNFDLYLLKHESLKDNSFSFIINSGLDLKKFERKYTQTLFIMAQLYSKLEKVEEAMEYCGLTMKRQLKTKEYELKDWVVNATTLADAFLGKEHFAQAEYLLFAAYHMLPEDNTKKKGLRAMV